MVIQGTLPRPSNLEVYLGDAGIYCRQLDPIEPAEGQEVAVGAANAGSGTAVATEGMPLYMFS